MADTKISDLTAVTTPLSTDEYAVNQGGTSKKSTRGQTALLADSEYTAAGVLVYPGFEDQTVAYNADSTVNTFTCTHNSLTWTLTMTYTSGNVTLMTATDSSTSWTRTLTYNSDNQVTDGGSWA